MNHQLRAFFIYGCCCAGCAAGTPNAPKVNDYKYALEMCFHEALDWNEYAKCEAEVDARYGVKR